MFQLQFFLPGSLTVKRKIICTCLNAVPLDISRKYPHNFEFYLSCDGWKKDVEKHLG